MSNLTIILLMAVITFGVRYLFFSSVITFELGEGLKGVLSFAGICVLSAMVAPIVFTPVDDPVYTSPYILGGIATLFLSLILRNTLIIVVSGMGVFLVINYMI
ncbi:MAG: AzlD domain-containing protein [Sedimenticola sp.]